MVDEGWVDQSLLAVEEVFAFDSRRQPSGDNQAVKVASSSGAVLPSAATQGRPMAVPSLPNPDIPPVQAAVVSGVHLALNRPSGANTQVPASPSPRAVAGQPFTLEERLSAMNAQPPPASTLSQVAITNVQATDSSSRTTPVPTSPRKELKLASELASMIEHDLTQYPGHPGNGFRVTVYGLAPWRAMLTISPAAGAVREPHKWRDLTDELADRLRARYDVAWDR